MEEFINPNSGFFFVIPVLASQSASARRRENGNPECLKALKTQLDTRFRGYDGRGASTFFVDTAPFFLKESL